MPIIHGVEVAFKISSMTKGGTFYQQDLRQFIQFASLKAMPWAFVVPHQLSVASMGAADCRSESATALS